LGSVGEVERETGLEQGGEMTVDGELHPAITSAEDLG